MNKRMFYMGMLVLVMVFIFDSAYCGITDEQIKAASKTFIRLCRQSDLA